jgi:hypothetical protein
MAVTIIAVYSYRLFFAPSRAALPGELRREGRRGEGREKHVTMGERKPWTWSQASSWRIYPSELKPDWFSEQKYSLLIG